VLEAAFQPVNPGNTVGPAGGIAVPLQQLLEDVSDWDLDPDPVDIQHRILGNLHPDALHDPSAVVYPFLFGGKLDQGGEFRLVQEECFDVCPDPFASFRGVHVRPVPFPLRLK
jgi:hypothetical protein